ncbi:MAG: LLM class flavin-dependent oxidoreductase [Lapillicoccus sp.]
MSLALSVATRSGLSVAAVADLARRAEHQRLDAFYLAESASDAFVLAQAALAATVDIEVGTAVANARLRHPAAAAMTAAMLDDWSGGRFRLGLGVSNARFNEGWLGMPPVAPVDFMRDYLAAVRAVLEPSASGTGAAAPAFALDRPPARPVSLALAALQPRMLRLAGEVADSVLLSLTTPRSIGGVLDEIRLGAARRAAGRDAVRVECVLPCCFDADLASARRAGRDVVIGYARHPAATRLFAERGFAAELASVVAALDAGDVDAAHAVIRDEMVDDFVLVGDPAACADRIASYLARGVDRVILFPLPHAGDWAGAVSAAIDVSPTLAAGIAAPTDLPPG